MSDLWCEEVAIAHTLSNRTMIEGNDNLTTELSIIR